MIISTFLIYINGILLYIITIFIFIFIINVIDISLYIYILIISHLILISWVIPSNIPSTIPGMGTGKVALQLFLSTPTPRHVYGVEMALHHEGARSHGSHSELACGELNPWIQSWSVYTTHHVLTSEIIPGIFHILVEGF